MITIIKLVLIFFGLLLLDCNGSKISANSILENKIGAREVVSTPLEKGTIFVSPNGTGTGNTADDTCNFKAMKNKLLPGDVVFLRGGTYEMDQETHRLYQIDASGTTESPIIIESYPNELAIFDGISTKDRNNRNLSTVWLKGDYIHFRKVEVKNMVGSGIYIKGNHNIVEGVEVHHNSNGIGIMNGTEWYTDNDLGGSYNIIRDVVSHDNTHPTSGSADGIAISTGVKNTIIHCEVYGNSDDGIDTWASNHTRVEYCLAHHNGVDSIKNSEGNGIKLGGITEKVAAKKGTVASYDKLGINVVAKHNISYSNKMQGFTANCGKNTVMEFNTAYANYQGFYGMSDSILKNNISTNSTRIGRKGNIVEFVSGNILINNNFTKEGVVDIDFISTNPNSPDFLKPVAGSGFENIGAYVGKVK